GVAGHAKSEIHSALAARSDVFKALIGVDEEVADRGSVIFEVWLDGKRAFQSSAMTGSMPGAAIEVPVEDAREMALIVNGADSDMGFDHADWADARFEGVEQVKYLSDVNWVSATNGSGRVE